MSTIFGPNDVQKFAVLDWWNTNVCEMFYTVRKHWQRKGERLAKNGRIARLLEKLITSSIRIMLVIQTKVYKYNVTANEVQLIDDTYRMLMNFFRSVTTFPTRLEQVFKGNGIIVYVYFQFVLILQKTTNTLYLLQILRHGLVLMRHIFLWLLFVEDVLNYHFDEWQMHSNPILIKVTGCFTGLDLRNQSISNLNFWSPPFLFNCKISGFRKVILLIRYHFSYLLFTVKDCIWL